MGLISFINLNNYSITDEVTNYIYCDYEIRNIIAGLNKKGYTTKYSCAGHNHAGSKEIIQRKIIREYEKFKKENIKDKAIHIIDTDKYYFYLKNDITETNIYIMFNEIYKFNILPKSFILKTYNNKSYLSKKIPYYEDELHENLRNDKDIFDELDESYKELETWVKNLEDINYKYE